MPTQSLELTAPDGAVYLAVPAGVWDAPQGFTPALDDPDCWDRGGVFYDGEPRPGGATPLYRLVPTGSLELLGVADIARRLGLSRPRVWQLRRRPGFPTPAGRYGDRDLWREITIRRWAAANGRSFAEHDAGRPLGATRALETTPGSRPGPRQETNLCPRPARAGR